MAVTGPYMVSILYSRELAGQYVKDIICGVILLEKTKLPVLYALAISPQKSR
jgi:hypothetical protein